MTPEAIKQLALDAFKQNVFFSTMILEHDLHLTSSIFMTLLFLDEHQIKAFEKNNIAAVYEYYDKSLPRSINGYPIFMSMNSITKNDLDEVKRIVEQLKEATDNVT